MRTLRFYVPVALSTGSLIEAPESTARHMVQVLRLRVGDQVVLFNGNNFEFTSSIKEIKKKSVFLQISGEKLISRESPSQIHLIQAISKGDRMDWVIQKAVELGVCSIRPVISKRNSVNLSDQRLDKKMQHWGGVITSACEQCGRNQIPTLHNIKTLESAIAEPDLQNSVHRIMLDPSGQYKLQHEIKAHNAFAVAVGPEGGFDADESRLLSNSGFISYSFGPRILRTETAAIACLSVLQMLSGDL